MIIYAIIVTYNARHKNWIDRCLRSLADSTVSVTPIIIDNGSTDGTREYVPTAYPEAVWLPQESNLGFGQANNVGLRYALNHQANYVLLLNQDAALAPDALELMLACSDNKSLLSPIHLNGDGSRVDEMFRETLKANTTQLQDDLLARHTLSRSYLTGEVCAACWLLPISVVNAVGGFNPLFFHYSEDNNYYHRLIFHGIDTILVPQARMYHDRTLHGNKFVYDHHRVRRELTLTACNINMGWRRRLTSYLRMFCRYYVYEWPQHSYRPGSLLTATVWLLFHYSTICHSRQAEKQYGLTWL